MWGAVESREEAREALRAFEESRRADLALGHGEQIKHRPRKCGNREAVATRRREKHKGKRTPRVR